MSSSSQNLPSGSRDELVLFALSLTSGHAIPEQVGARLGRLIDARDADVRTQTLTAAVEAARSEYLTDNTGTPEDEAYNQGVTDAIAAIGKLLEGGAS